MSRSVTVINLISAKSETDTKDYTLLVSPGPRLTARRTECHTSGSTVLQTSIQELTHTTTVSQSQTSIAEHCLAQWARGPHL
jgi:hypothetical protein